MSYYFSFIVWLGQFIMAAPIYSQTDSIYREQRLEEVMVTSDLPSDSKVSNKGRVATVEEHLLQLQGVEMVRRGAYAWEPVVNGMQTERVSTTIDGMKIFYACTDKMDPVTSYVESGNLKRISLNSGLDGNPQATGNIGGSLDLKLRKVGFDAQPQEYNVSVGTEHNGWLQVYGADAALSSHRHYANFGLFYRHAGNYKIGGGEELRFSQFTKTNAFLNFGWRPAERDAVEGTVIYDVATDVGYPALNMDVKDARGLITSLSYRHQWKETMLDSWETKVYYNRITHDMDDTKRPDVPIHMDMPGRSHTAGFYSLLQGVLGNHQWQANIDGYRNVLYADMTMYAGSAPMFMLTWPDVATVCNGLSFTDDIRLRHGHSLRFSAKGSWQQRKIRNDEGFRALEIYFPGMTRSVSALFGRVALGYAYDNGPWHTAAGLGLGSRTPTVTEQYGYFLNNTFDRYDYIGNPALKKERAVEVNAAFSWKDSRWLLKAEANTFFFSNYIIGEPDERLSAMTIGAAGVKIYRNMSNARIVNATLTANVWLFPWLQWKNRLTYSYGDEATGSRLPLIAPLTYRPSLFLRWKSLTAEAGADFVTRCNGADKYGEHPTAGYAIWHFSAGYPLTIGNMTVVFRGGVENLFDRRYTTYSDWNGIPQKGRNIYVNIQLSF